MMLDLLEALFYAYALKIRRSFGIELALCIKTLEQISNENENHCFVPSLISRLNVSLFQHLF